MKLNEKIMYCRKKAGLSQLDLADLLGVSRQSVSKWETGESNPDISKITPLAKAFGVTADWLLSEEEPVETPRDANASVEAKPEAPVSKPYPDWVDHLPKYLGSMIKRFGWIYGVRLAIGGAVFTAFGCIARAMFRSMIFGSNFDPMVGNNSFQTSGGDLGYAIGSSDLFFDAAFDSFRADTWHIPSLFTGFIIGLGIVIMIGGIILAVILKKWGSKQP